MWLLRPHVGRETLRGTKWVKVSGSCQEETVAAIETTTALLLQVAGSLGFELR
ncbi:hypothetical protein RERY_00540 [Rhodococcus erythropolis]|jgi:hypothetical protein|nr:hypothetical protein [Rhodococcus erythropolis]OFV79297.1 hypothetical protein RERY_00540 [Rhodococcus erythropolis]